MDASTSITNKNALDLLKGISLSASLQKSKDSILLAEDQYPENLDPIFGKAEATSDLCLEKKDKHFRTFVNIFKMLKSS